MLKFKFIYSHNGKICGNIIICTEWTMGVEAVDRHVELYVNDEVQ